MQTTECVRCDICRTFIDKKTGEYLVLDNLKLSQNKRSKHWDEKSAYLGQLTELKESRVFCNINCLTQYFSNLIKESN